MPPLPVLFLNYRFFHNAACNQTRYLFRRVRRPNIRSVYSRLLFPYFPAHHQQPRSSLRSAKGRCLPESACAADSPSPEITQERSEAAANNILCTPGFSVVFFFASLHSNPFTLYLIYFNFSNSFIRSVTGLTGIYVPLRSVLNRCHRHLAPPYQIRKAQKNACKQSFFVFLLFGTAHCLRTLYPIHM